MNIVKVNLDFDTGIPVIPDEIKGRVRNGERIHIEILSHTSGFVKNALKWGVAGLWIDGGRVPGQAGDGWWGKHHRLDSKSTFGCSTPDESWTPDQKGRWPANLLHDGSDEVVGLFPNSRDGVAVGRNASAGKVYGGGKGLISQDKGEERLGYGGNGSAARFFYCAPQDTPSRIFYAAKASRAERNAGLEGMEEGPPPGSKRSKPAPGRVSALGAPRANHHPCVKPLALMRYLVRLTRTPTGGTVLDPFMGSGSTGIACVHEDRPFIGIEKNEEYFEIAKARIGHAMRGTSLPNEDMEPKKTTQENVEPVIEDVQTTFI